VTLGSLDKRTFANIVGVALEQLVISEGLVFAIGDDFGVDVAPLHVGGEGVEDGEGGVVLGTLLHRRCLAHFHIRLIYQHLRHLRFVED